MKKKIWIISILALAVVCGCDDDNGNAGTTNSQQQQDECNEPGYVKCGESCINPLISREYCGADESCQGFTKCGSNESCKSGVCTKNGTGPSVKPTCSVEGAVSCNGRCIDPKTEKQYCGADENCLNYKTCSETQTCNEGRCVDQTCEDRGLITCSNTCIDPKTDPYYCGATAGCATYDSCDETREKCENGQCVIDESKVIRCEVPGQVNCNNECIDPKTDMKFCGADDLCTDAQHCDEATQECRNGVCIALGSCSDGLICDGACIDPDKSHDHCGATVDDCTDGTQCEESEVCIDGECKDPTSDCQYPNIYCSDFKKCIDPMTDDEFCGIYSNCTGGQRCLEQGTEYGCVRGKCEVVVNCVDNFKDSVMKEFALRNWDFNENNCIDNQDIQKLTQEKFEEVDQNLAGMNFVSVDDLNMFTHVTKLAKNTFKGCTKLQKVNLINITEMGENVFEGCTALTDIEMPAITTLPDLAFKGCTKLKNATFNNVTKFNLTPFEGCTRLNKLSLTTPNAITMNKGVFNNTDEEAEKDETEDVTLTLNQNKENDVEIHGIYGFRTFLWNGKYWYGVNYPK